MNWFLVVIFATTFYLKDCVAGVYTVNASSVAASQLEGHKNLDPSGGLAKYTTSTQGSAGVDDPRCTTLDDVTAARRSLCPVQCRCSPLDGQEAWTKLTVVCSAGIHQSNFTQQLVQLLSTCTSQLLELTITITPLTAVPEVVCRLSNIQSLNLNSNHLTSLPSNCFTQMRNLTSFSANNNSLMLLQVRQNLPLTCLV